MGHEWNERAERDGDRAGQSGEAPESFAQGGMPCEGPRIDPMRTLVTLIPLILAGVLHGAPPARAADPPGLEGRWLTFDGAPRERRSLVEVTRRDGKIAGRIAELYLKPGEDPDPRCDDCPGEAKGQRIRGLAILSLEAEPGGATYRGNVLDPDEGKVYRCTVTLEEGGRRLVLRGYVGVPLFGRSETWERAP